MRPVPTARRAPSRALPGAFPGTGRRVPLGPGAGFLPLLLLLLVACDRRLDPGREGSLALAQNLWRAGALEVFVDEGTTPAAERERERWSRVLPGLEVRVLPLESGLDGEAARLLVGSPDQEPLRGALERAGVRVLPGAGPDAAPRASLLERDAPLADLTFVLTFADPLRDRLPLTVLADADPGRRAANLAHLRPGWRPELLVLRRGELWLELPLAADGSPRALELVEHRARRVHDVEAYRRLDGRVGDWKVYADRRLTEGRLDAYLENLERVAERLAPRLEGGTASVPRTGWTLLAEVELDGFARTDGPTQDLARCDLPSRTLLALLPEGAGATLDDGGYAYAAALVSGSLGTPARHGLLEGLAASVANPLAEREPALLLRALEGLGDGELRAILSDEADGLRSRLLLRALRGVFVAAALESTDPDGEGGAAWFHRAWRGEPGAEAAFVDLALGRRDAVLASLREAARGSTAVPGSVSEESRRPLRGVLLTAPAPSPDAVRAGGPCLSFGGAAARASLAHVASLHATTVGLCVDLCLEPDPGTGRAWQPRSGLGTLQGDAGVRLALAQARELGLDTWLGTTLLERRSGLPAGRLVRVTARDWDDLFDALAAATEHTALLGALGGVRVLDLASDQAEAMRTVWTLPGEENEVQRTARERKTLGWARVLDRARSLCPGTVTVSASRPGSLDWLGFRGDLDLVTCGFFPHLHEPDGSEPDPRRAGRRMAGLLLPAVQAAADVGRPLVLAPVGFRATADAWRGPGEDGGPADPARQAMLLWSLEQALRHLGQRGDAVPGVMLWRGSTDPDAGAEGERDYLFRGQAADSVLRNWWKR